MAIHYETNCGQFVMYRDGKPVMRPLDEVALAVGSDGDGGCCCTSTASQPVCGPGLQR